MPPWAVVVGVVALAVAVVVLHNRLVSARVRVDEAWAQVAAQLQRRHDLIPSVVATVGAYVRHESQTLSAVTTARVKALTAAPGRDREAAEETLGAALGRLLAITESYPELRADERFAHLQRELTETEDRLAFARGFANERVRRYHELTGTFPANLVARAFRFGPARSFAVDDVLARNAPVVGLER